MTLLIFYLCPIDGTLCKTISMRTMQLLLTNPSHIEHRIYVQASPEESWNVARHFDMSNIQ
jgi:hypothetical protein